MSGIPSKAVKVFPPCHVDVGFSMTAKNKKRVLLAAAVVAPLLVAPSIVRAYAIAGPSMAPTLWLGDRVLVLSTAYDLKIPFTDRVLTRTWEPQHGDVIAYYDTNKKALAIKRVIGLPGDQIELRDGIVYLNGEAVERRDAPAGQFDDVPGENGLGESIALEIIGSVQHAVTYTEGAGRYRNHDRTIVPEDQYFLLGDHRDNSADSRLIGCIHRDQLRGRVIYGLRGESRN